MPQTHPERVYTFVRTYLHQVGYPPNFNEIGQACQLHQDQVLSSLLRLEQAGRLRFRPDRPRSLRLPGEG